MKKKYRRSSLRDLDDVARIAGRDSDLRFDTFREGGLGTQYRRQGRQFFDGENAAGGLTAGPQFDQRDDGTVRGHWGGDLSGEWEEFP